MPRLAALLPPLKVLPKEYRGDWWREAILVFVFVFFGFFFTLFVTTKLLGITLL